MTRFREHLNELLKDDEFAALYEEEKRLLDISIRLAIEREKQGLTQQELAQKAHVTQQQLSKLERGLNCNMNTFLKVCKALKVKLDIKSNAA